MKRLLTKEKVTFKLARSTTVEGVTLKMRTEDKDNILHKLREMTYKRETSLIKKTLNNIDKFIKGKIFEEYLAFLFEGNGFVATVNGSSHDGGADILLSRKSNPNKIVWIVQAKNTSKPLGNPDIREELIKFENESSKKYSCKYFMIISLNGYVEKISIFNKTNMSLENFEYIEELINNFCDDKEGQVLLPDLRPHNRYTYKEIKAILENKNRVAVPNATGTGKSFIILQLLFDYIDKESIVLAPTNEILERIKSIAPWSVKKCRFYTYSKFSSMYSKNKLEDVKVDLIILDELHRAGALNWGKAVKHILNENQTSKVVGLSATPIRFLDNNRDMINELLNGVSTTPLSLSEAIVRRILPSPIYVSAMYNLDKEIEKKLKLMKKYNLSTEDKKKYMEELNIYKKLYEKDNRIENIIKKHLPKESNMKFIVFCENNKHLREMKDEVTLWFRSILEEDINIKEYVITSESNRNTDELFDFENNNRKNEVKLLFSISKLNEGIHIKNITGIIMLRNTKSPSIYYQQLGRCLTADSANKNPIIFDFVDNIDNLELLNFRAKIEEANALHNIYRQSIGVEGRNIRLALYQEHEELISQLKNIEKRITYNWEKSFEALKEFKELYGHVNIPKSEEYSRLYSWASLQRTLYNKQILNEEFIEKLNSVDFIWDLRFYKWKENYEKYEEFISKCYNKRVSYYRIISKKYYIPVYEVDYDIKSNTAIINWMDKQIREYQKGTLDKARRDILINQFKVISRFEEDKWIESVYKIVDFYRYIKDTYNIDCYLNRIAPDKKNYINLLSSLYLNGNIIKNTIEKALPRESQSLNLKYINDESWNMGFIIYILQSNKLDKTMNEFIDDLNIIYFQDMIDSYEELIERWHNSNYDINTLDNDKIRLLDSISYNVKVS